MTVSKPIEMVVDLSKSDCASMTVLLERESEDPSADSMNPTTPCEGSGDFPAKQACFSGSGNSVWTRQMRLPY